MELKPIILLVIFYGKMYIGDYMIDIFYSENKDFEKIEVDKLIKFQKVVKDLTPENIIDFIGNIDSYNLFHEDTTYIIYGVDFFSIKSSKYNKVSINQFLEFAASSSDQFIFIIEKKVNKTTTPFKDFYDFITYHEIKDDKNTFNKYLNSFIKENNIIIEDNALHALINGTDGNFLLISNELLKCQEFEKNISVDTLRAISSIEAQSNIFNLINYILQDNNKKASILYNELIDAGQNAVSLVSLLASQIRFMRQVKVLNQPDSQTATILKTNSYRVKATKKILSSVSLNKINDVYLRIGEIDYNIKSGKMNEELILVYLLNAH